LEIFLEYIIGGIVGLISLVFLLKQNAAATSADNNPTTFQTSEHILPKDLVDPLLALQHSDVPFAQKALELLNSIALSPKEKISALVGFDTAKTLLYVGQRVAKDSKADLSNSMRPPATSKDLLLFSIAAGQMPPSNSVMQHRTVFIFYGAILLFSTELAEKTPSLQNPVITSWLSLLDGSEEIQWAIENLNFWSKDELNSIDPRTLGQSDNKLFLLNFLLPDWVRKHPLTKETAKNRWGLFCLGNHYSALK